MTVAELRERVSTAEYAQWVGFYQWKTEEEKREMAKQHGGS